jgi:trehalose/maltose transport system substrate-binding protein
MRKPSAPLSNTILRLIAAAIACQAVSAGAATLTLACDAVGLGEQVCREGAEAWARDTGHSVKLVPVPRSSTRRFELYKQLLEARSATVDIYMIDIVWPGMLSPHFIDLKRAAAGVTNRHFPSIMASNAVAGRLIAMPWFTDAGLLFYRKDLLTRYGLAVPQTWEELTRTARTIQAGERRRGKHKFWGYVWQGKAYEGLTCNILEWVASSGGGTIVDGAGRVTIDNGDAIEALQRAKAWIGDITPASTLAADEDDSIAAFAAGNAAFMRNWPYALVQTNAGESVVRGQVGIAQLPRGKSGVSVAALGGQQLAVSRYSSHRDEAISLVMYLTSRAEQKRRALVLGVNPTITDLYSDPDILAATPHGAILKQAIASAIARPSTVTGERYEGVTRALSEMTHSILAEGKDAPSTVKNLARRLETMRGEANWHDIPPLRSAR